jgi:hypothetical protein
VPSIRGRLEVGEAELIAELLVELLAELFCWA